MPDQIRSAGVTPTLDEDAMVKVAVIGRKWITYDDEDTFKLKVKAASKMCIGGVMVWAVSQDYVGNPTKVASVVGSIKKKRLAGSGLYDTRYSAQLQAATKYKSLRAVTVKTDLGDINQPSPNIVRNQCYWANCGTSCDRGYTTVPRIDGDAAESEVMQDGNHCQGGTLRQFCYPDSKTIPKCGWFDFNNGDCGQSGACPAGTSEEIIGPSGQQREVGSTGIACNNGRAQVACCQTETDAGKALDSMIGYDMCKWFGTAPDACDAIISDDIPRTDACKIDDTDRLFYTLESFWGSGATSCWKNDYEQYCPLCCKTPAAGKQWIRCKKVFTERKDNFCQGYYPARTIRMAMEKPENYENCKGSTNAVCCKP